MKMPCSMLKKTEEKFCCLGKKSLTLQRETIVLY